MRESSTGLTATAKELAALVASMNPGKKKKKKVAINCVGTLSEAHAKGLERAIAATKELETLVHVMDSAHKQVDSKSKQISSSQPDPPKTSKQTRCRLLELPGELRNRIYKLVLVADEPVLVSGDNAQETQWKQLRLG